MRKIILLLTLLVSFQLTAFCQNDNNPSAKLKAYSASHLIEKAYLHFDKPYYAGGDTMYFKAYVTFGDQHELSKMSGILHVDLIAPDNQIQQSIKLGLNGGLGWGDFALPVSLKQGNYRVRAYTQWMRNYGPSEFFDKVIPIGSITDNGPAASANMGKENDIQFFPEGGTLVAEMKCKVAFKAINSKGLGVDVKGVVVDNANATVATFESQHLGMGAFNLVPETGKTYKAKLTYADGSQNTVMLPAAAPKGIVLVVKNDDPAKIAMEVHANKAYFDENKDKNITIVVYSGVSMTTLNTKLDTRVLYADFPKNTFPTHTVQFTLFSASGEPLSERLAFVQNPDALKLDVSANKATFSKRENVQLKLNSADKDAKGVSGHFSIAVIDENKVKVDDNSERTILTELLLASDLKGYIEQPSYYFNNVSDQTKADLDVLMLTQGFRRFTWKQVLSDNNGQMAFKPEKNLEITGVLKTTKGDPLAKRDIVLRSNIGGQIIQQQTDANGKFTFPEMYYADNTPFVLQLSNTKDKNVIIAVDQGAGPLPAESNHDPVMFDNVNSKIGSYLDNERRIIAEATPTQVTGKTLANVTVTDTKQSYRSSNLGGPGHADQVIPGDRFKGASTLSAGLNGILRGVDIIQGVPYLQGNAVLSGGTEVHEPMYLVVDGAKIGRVSLDNYNPNEVETVELLKGPNASIYGMDGGAGVLVLTLRISSLSSTPDTKESSGGTLQFNPKGFYKAREFYSPKYSPGVSGKANDLRTTIFWSPETVTDSNGNAFLEYFNADGTGTYKVIVEGIDSKGNIARQVFRYKVQ